jgi:hypothetical protein
MLNITVCVCFGGLVEGNRDIMEDDSELSS